MHLDDRFPLNDVPPRARKAVLAEITGPSPSVREVREISDRRWLATPEISERSLSIIHRITEPERTSTDVSSPSRMTEAELLRRLCFVQRELEALERLLKVRLRRARPGRARNGSAELHGYLRRP
jgi:hypothetical protein